MDFIKNYIRKLIGVTRQRANAAFTRCRNNRSTTFLLGKFVPFIVIVIIIFHVFGTLLLVETISLSNCLAL